MTSIPKACSDDRSRPSRRIGPVSPPPSKRRERIRTAILRVAVGLALAAVAVIVQLGLDQVVLVAPWLIVAFVGVLLAAILGSVAGGVVAAVVVVAAEELAIPGWVPDLRAAAGAAWPYQLTTVIAGFVLGTVIRRAMLLARGRAARVPPAPASDGIARHGVRSSDDATADAARVAPPAPVAPADLAVLAAAVRDFVAVRTPVQVADALGRHAAALTGAPRATVLLRTADGAFVPAAAGAAHESDVETADRLTDDALRSAIAAGDAGLIPVTTRVGAREEVVAVIRLPPTDRPPRRGPLFDAVVLLAADALERIRLETGRRSAADEATGAARRLASLGGLALELVGGRTIEDVATTLLDFAVDDLGAGFAAVHAPEPDGGPLRLIRARGVPAGLVAGMRTVERDAEAPVSAAFRAQRPVDIAGEDGWAAAYPRTSNLAAITGVRGITALPMAAGGTPHGVLTIGWRTIEDRAGADRALLAAAAAQGAQALERATLHAQDEEARRFQEAFIGVVSHELRTPITTILAGSRLLRRRLDADERAADLSDDILVEAERLTRIVDDLLVLSRLERRHLTVGDDPVHLDHLAARIVRAESARWPQHRFEIVPSPGRHVVLGDETYVEQVLRNLLSNAGKYSPAGSMVQVTVADVAAGEVEVRVLDDGPGISPAEIDELFSLFYRSPSTAGSASGAGIGLFVSRRLVTEMGGRVWARPRPAGGSEFGFALRSYPIDEPDLDDDDEPELPHLATPAGAVDRGIGPSRGRPVPGSADSGLGGSGRQ